MPMRTIPHGCGCANSNLAVQRIPTRSLEKYAEASATTDGLSRMTTNDLACGMAQMWPVLT